VVEIGPPDDRKDDPSVKLIWRMNTRGVVEEEERQQDRRGEERERPDAGCPLAPSRDVQGCGQKRREGTGFSAHPTMPSG